MVSIFSRLRARHNANVMQRRARLGQAQQKVTRFIKFGASQLKEGFKATGRGGGVATALLPGVGIAGRSAKLGKAIFSGVKGAVVKSAVPVVGKSILGRAGKYIGASVGGGLIYSGLTNQPVNQSVKKTGLIALGYGLGGFPGAIAGGVASGFYGVEQTGKKAINLVEGAFTPSNMSFPGNNVPTPNYTGGSNVYNFPTGLETPAPSYTGGSQTFAPSISTGGGGGGIPPELLALLLGVGVGGYALGRRRRKKKKSKKRKN